MRVITEHDIIQARQRVAVAEAAQQQQDFGAENNAPFPSVIVYLGPDRENFIEYFGDLGTIMERAS